VTDPDPERARRVGLNEALFREINDRLEVLAHRSSVQATSCASAVIETAVSESP